jgi:hypothetical protein
VEILDLAATQHAAFSRHQAHDHGTTDRQLDRLSDKGIICLASP